MLNPFLNRKQQLSVPESLLLKKLKSVASHNNFFLFEQVTLYHKNNTHFIPLLLIDSQRGIYLFEYKEWSYDELKRSSIKKSTHLSQSNNTLAFENIHEIIYEKLHLEDEKKLPIYNFLLMENLDDGQYKYLDSHFQELLPREKILFSNSNAINILEKLHATSMPKKDIMKPSDILNKIVFQYSIVDNELNTHLVTKQQKEFIFSDIKTHCSLNGAIGSGKSSALLTKAIFEHLKHKQDKIVIIKQTMLSCDLMKKRLEYIAQDITLDIDINQIEILTPIMFINIHFKAIGEGELKNKIEIDKKILKKRFDIYNLILCDEADFLPRDFISYLLNVYQNTPLVFVTNNQFDVTYTFEKSFRITNQKKLFYQGDVYEKTLELLEELLFSTKQKDILIVCDAVNCSILHTDILYQFELDATILDATKNSHEQNLDTVLLSTYGNFNGVNAEHIIVLDICDAPLRELAYLFFLSQATTHIVYEEECEKIISLKNNLKTKEK